MNEFYKPATVYFFADRDTGTVHDFKITDEPRHDAFLTDFDIHQCRRFGATITDHGEYLTIDASNVGTISKIKKVEVLFNEDEDKFKFNGIVFDVEFHNGGYFFTMSEVQ